MKNFLFLMIAGCVLIAAPRTVAQPADDGGLQDEGGNAAGNGGATDEIIFKQKRLHPELRGLSNQQIRDKLQSKGKAEDALGPADTVVQAGPAGRKLVEPEKGKPGMRAEKAIGVEALEGLQENSRFPAGMIRFGYDFFTNNPKAAHASGNAPALPEYVLSPGDEIQIYTWGRENQSQTVIIDNEGVIRYPPLQPMRIAGMRFADAQSLVIKEIEKINGIKASMGLGKLKSIRVFVLGEAVSPGSYVVPAGATVTTALFLSGGITPIGSLREIQLKRNGSVAATLDLYEMLMKGRNKGDQQLVSGDVIFVPVASIQAAITGMVKRSGIYEVKPGTRVLDGLELAGGLSSNAFKGRVRLDRIENHKRKVVLDIGMEKMAGNANVTLQDGDILNVESVLPREYDVVYLEGNVNRPGRYEFKKGMTIKDLIPGVKDLKTETFFTYGHIKRSSDDDQGSLLLPFSLKDVFENGVVVPLAPRDTVIVYSKFDIMDKPEVKISGVVRRPGSYPFVEKMRVSDLIISGGGLTVDAFLPQAHLIRALRIQESDSLYSTLIKVDLSNLIDNPGDANNVELRPSDSLIIFPRSNFIMPKWVTVVGAVKRGGRFELTQNMGVGELVSQAAGLTRNSYKLGIEVVRKVIEKDSLVRREVFRLNLKEVLEGKAAFVLQDGDAVYIREVVDPGGSTVVTLNGEFNFPGRYEATKGEKLSEVIERAGGFTKSAYMRGAVFIRESVRQRQLQAIGDIYRRLEDQQRNLLTQTVNEKDRASIQLAIEQRRAMLEEVRNAPNLGRVVVNLDGDFDFRGSDDDITLEDGDMLFVDRFPNIISIMGEVFSPTNVVFTRSTNTVGECLDRAGGVGEYGDADNVYYMRPDGSIVTPKTTSFFRWASVEAGGVIVVPPKGPKKDYLDALVKITQAIYQIAVSVGVVKTLFFP